MLHLLSTSIPFVEQLNFELLQVLQAKLQGPMVQTIMDDPPGISRIETSLCLLCVCVLCVWASTLRGGKNLPLTT